MTVTESIRSNRVMSRLKKYLHTVPEEAHSSTAIAYFAAIDAVAEVSPEIAESIIQELRDQRSHLKLIASENFSSLPVQLAMGNLLTDKYSEGHPFHRFYAGCENVDAVESRAVELAQRLFGAEHAYVQPHSGADANLVALWAVLVQRVQTKEIEALGKKKLEELTPEEYETVRRIVMSQKLMGMSLGSGGHLTHGYRHNISSKIMQAVPYDVDPSTGFLDYSALEQLVLREKPLILVAGYSSYPRAINFAIMREIADRAGAVLMVDMAHFAGLVAGKVMQGDFNPVPFAHIVTSTTHKTLRGPRGGFILTTQEFKEVVNKGCPLVLGGPLPHVMAAKAVALKEALDPSFALYAHQIVKNAQRLTVELMRHGVRILTGGTDNHLLVMDVAASFGLNGRQAETLLRSARLTVSRNVIPHDPQGAWYTSGVRLGTPAVTTLGMKEPEMEHLAKMIVELLRAAKPCATDKGAASKERVQVDPALLQRIHKEVAELLGQFPLYPELVSHLCN